MPQHGIIIKLAKGSPVPPGFTFVRSLRTANVYKKNEPAPVPKQEIDDLADIFAKMGVAAEVKPVTNMSNALMNMAGGKKKTRKNRKSKRNTRRRR